MAAIDPDVVNVATRRRRCPKCGLPVIKDGGCEHMVCPLASGGCGHEYCFQCGKPWAVHGAETGGFFACSIADVAEEAGELTGDEGAMRSATRKERLLKAFRLKVTFIEGFHDSAKEARKVLLEQQGFSDLAPRMLRLLAAAGVDDDEAAAALAVVQQASDAVAKCRDATAWSHVALLYLHDVADEQRRFFFTQNQPLLHRLTMLLQQKLEESLPALVRRASTDADALLAFLRTLADDATNMLAARHKVGEDLAGADEGAPEMPAALDVDAVAAEEEGGGEWDCEACTFHNADPAARRCEVCDTVRRGYADDGEDDEDEDEEGGEDVGDSEDDDDEDE
uniref:RING-type domain-containing protein n=1 Tax=Bicosoecida sp. CB-2014 TaxID=1486930 RepID=A0A7S1CPB2_9STRA